MVRIALPLTIVMATACFQCSPPRPVETVERAPSTLMVGNPDPMLLSLLARNAPKPDEKIEVAVRFH